MLKQKGAWQAVGRQPAESSLDFNNLFDHEVNDFAKALETDCGKKEDLARELASAEFQVCYINESSSIIEILSNYKQKFLAWPCILYLVAIEVWKAST